MQLDPTDEVMHLDLDLPDSGGLRAAAEVNQLTVVSLKESQRVA